MLNSLLILKLGINAPSLHSDCNKPFVPGLNFFMPYADKEKAKAHAKIYNQNNIERKKEHNKKYRDANREVINKNANEWAKNNPSVIKNYRLKSRYGASLELYNNLLEKQNGCCAICKIHHTKFGRSLHLDHCHKLNILRGVLCVNCNTALGHFKEDVSLLQQAIDFDISELSVDSKKGLSKFCGDISNLKTAIEYLSK